MKCVTLFFAVVFPLGLLAQNGDKQGESQAPPPEKYRLPPSPPLTPEDALNSFQLPPGFAIELVASEPLVVDPVAMAFDPDGRIWVVEMRGYMPDVLGTNERQPVGRVVVLEDTNGDGRMDKNTVFLDQLVMPRALSILDKGVLIAEPPNLWFCQDVDGDLVCDKRKKIASDYAIEDDPKLGKQANPEHASNGLMWAMDNWIYSANYTARFRYTEGKWERASTLSRGQWGITQDDYGRIYYNSNSDQLRGDLIPWDYLAQNPHFLEPVGASYRIAKDQTVWPGRINPGINRGYRRGMLREDGTLARYTGACGPVVYRGTDFPPEFRGNAFVCEPTGNLVRRNLISERDGVLDATNAYHQKEFLTSVDERFRPVNLYNGPDGCLYVVDFYRGLIQHRIYLTTFLRKQMEERWLDKPDRLGRIYRITYRGVPRGPTLKMSGMTARELVRQLRHPNGWQRDTAQRLLVERRDLEAVPALKRLASQIRHPLAQLHALWTLEGLGKLDVSTLRRAMGSPHPKVRAAAIRLSEPWLATDPGLVKHVLQFQDDLPEIQMQLALSLGRIQYPNRVQVLSSILSANLSHPLIPSAVISGLQDQELECLEFLARSSREGPPEASLRKVVETLAACVFRQGDAGRILHSLDLCAGPWSAEPGLRVAVLEGLKQAAFKRRQGKEVPRARPLAVAEEPAVLTTLANETDADIAARARLLLRAFRWPGKQVAKVEKVLPLTREEQALFDQGRDLYLISCGACHQPHGMGQEGLAPPIKDSDWLLGSPQRVARIVLYGLQGPIEVHGKKWQLAMPSLGIFNDKQLASILTYVRREWGHTASAVHPDLIGSIRKQYDGREEMWTAEELLKVP